ncbi:hypothetical protein D556_1132 [Bordetella holmesii 41130]|uniref:Uncharacterized protein n=2 Tax=Bordetella holmesii TaxID=35814 RepID=A0A158M4P0_9BORD|nr:hypothetical protein D558_1123 [Bordetella holmesii 44057]EWM42748.1 hypothetical protein D556_1132 [Bordetella holmesii 41130]EWM46367.1 hypothetical protein D555_1142 [Bordetella holmesii 35009]EWM50530.1 hypothetical protein D557_0375 [Bordetella holmesii 70147]EXX95621.1 hypothetical protein D559_3059 [Bordetella holmesii 1058]KAK89940.1 hypothetical protein L497_2794 [Bordetella holmesii CDC-H585-BH]KCV00520.1 hypothetical protein L498_0288 [Bordetella holmesii CDC-H629-BH]KCV06389.1
MQLGWRFDVAWALPVSSQSRWTWRARASRRDARLLCLRSLS